MAGPQQTRGPGRFDLDAAFPWRVARELVDKTVERECEPRGTGSRGKRMKKIIALLVGLSLLTFHTVALAAGQEAECEALV